MRRLTIRQLALVVLIALALGLTPIGLGVLFGFAAFVVTPILAIGLSVGTGALIARIAPQGRWIGVMITAGLVAAIYASVPWGLFLVQTSDKDAWIHVLPKATLTFLDAAAVIGALLALGARIFGPSTPVR